MAILNFLAQNWDSILIVVAFIGLFVFLYIKGEKKIIYKILLFLITEAEKLYGSGTGSLKLGYVINSIYDKLPKILKVFITTAQLVSWIEDALVLAKKTWAENAAIENYVKNTEKPTVAGANKE